MMDKIVNLFAVKNTGFMVVSRSAFATLLKMIQSHNWVSIYGYLLFDAQFGIGYTSTGQTLKRGELELSIDNFMEFLDCGRSYAYRKLRALEKSGLLQRIDKGNHCFRLPHYEEHCGKMYFQERVLKASDAIARTREECFDEFFGYYHFALNLPERERERARKEWYRLTPDEQEQAMEYIETYSETLPKPEHAKLACNYLKDKTYKG